MQISAKSFWGMEMEIAVGAPSPNAGTAGEAPVPGNKLPDDEVAESSQFISFAIGDEQYGVDIMAVREIKGWSEITHLPKQPEYVRGVLNLRGVMVPIIDLRCRFGQGVTRATALHIILVVQIGGRPVGLLADRVLDIVAANTAQMQPVPRVGEESRVDFLSGLMTIESGMIALIVLPHLLPASIGTGTDITASRPRAA
jgi:purine-binding chemotaxis protein CheW